METTEFKTFTVCKICFNSSRDKPNPRLTLRAKQDDDKCPKYPHDFIPVTVYQEPRSQKWESIRENIQIGKICRYEKEGKCRFGELCKFAHNDAELALHRKARRQQKQKSEEDQIREPPPIRVCNKYKMCPFKMEGHCYRGRYCTFAHSDAELLAWNQRRKPATTSTNQTSERISSTSPKGSGGLTSKHSPGMPEPSDAKLKPADSELKQESDSPDFASKIRSEIVNECREGKDLLSCCDETYENVTILNTSDLELSLVVSKEDLIEWTFRISVESTQTLSSVVLFDTLVSGFKICDSYLENSTTKKKAKLQVNERAQQGDGLRFEQEFGRNETIHMKVVYKPCSGMFGQMVIFCFTSPFRNFYMMRKLCVYMQSDVETLILSMGTQKQKATCTTDLFWEQHHEIIPMDAYPHAEEVDKKLPPYILPENVLELGTNQKARVKLTRDNYKERMHYLLYLEEHEHKKIMSRYDLYDLEIVPQRSRQQGDRTIGAPANFYFATLTLSEILFEGRKSIRLGDDAFIKCGSKVYQSVVCDVGRESVTLQISKDTSIACVNNSGKCSVRFVLGRLPIRAMHYAVDNIDLNTIFPNGSSSLAMENPSAFKKCKAELKSSDLNQLQANAVIYMLKHSSANIPSLVLGPFGSGKTRTLQVCASLVAKHYPDSHILVCTQSNSAADLYVKYLDTELSMRDAENYLLRLYYTGRSIFSIPECVRKYCRFDGTQLLMPTKTDIMEHKIIVTTLLTARVLFLMGIKKGHFSHILIDEAAQALETEAIIPLCLADDETKVILAGDYMQLVPPVYSPIAKHNCFHITLLERLYDHDIYRSSQNAEQCRTLLTENYRSHPEILALPSNLFYAKQLTCSAKLSFKKQFKDISPLKFVGVSSRECRDEGSPSYYNYLEAVEITEQVKQLVSKGVKQEDVCVLAYDKAQVDKIRILLRMSSLREVQAHRVHNVQGGEFRALIVSTVRTCLEESQDEGFLNDPKLLNTTITRAREWLIIVGEPITLCTVGSNCLCWKKIIKTCLKKNAFLYPNAQSFFLSLENKHIARELLETAFSGLLEDATPKKQSDSAFQQQIFQAPPKDPHTEQPSESGNLMPTEPDQPILLSESAADHKQQKPKIDGVEKTDPNNSTDIPQRLPDIQRSSNTPADSLLHRQIPFGHQNFPQSQFAHYPPHPQPSIFQPGMYPAHYPASAAGPVHAAYDAYPFQPLLHQPPFPIGGSSYPPPSYAYGYSSHLRPQQSADPRLYMGATAASHTQVSPRLESLAEQLYPPRGVHHHYTQTGHPNVRLQQPLDSHLPMSNYNYHNLQQSYMGAPRSQLPTGYPPEYPPSATQSPVNSDEIKEIEDVVILKKKSLGVGAFGCVFEGKYKRTNEKCAVKVLNRVGLELITSLPSASMRGSDDETLFSNFRRECELLESLDHPNIVKHLATRFYPDQNIPIIVMELLSCSLKDYIKKIELSPLPFFVQLSLDRDIASALVFLHSKSIVHHDLCEDNVLMLIKDGQIPVAKVSDFGMSRMLDLEQMSISLSSVRHRTAYLPPEVLINSKSYDASIDVFMFGVVMVQIAHSVSKIDTIEKRKQLLRNIPDNHPLKSPVDLFDLCVKDVKEDRPTAQKVYEIIMSIIPKCTF